MVSRRGYIWISGSQGQGYLFQNHPKFKGRKVIFDDQTLHPHLHIHPFQSITPLYSIYTTPGHPCTHTRYTHTRYTHLDPHRLALGPKMLSSLIITSFLGLALAAPPVLKRDNATAYTISSDRDGKCLSLPDGDATAPADGIALVALDCGTASGWIIDRGSGSVLLAANTGFALDAGENPGDHGGLKIWTSFPGLYQQT